MYSSISITISTALQAISDAVMYVNIVTNVHQLALSIPNSKESTYKLSYRLILLKKAPWYGDSGLNDNHVSSLH